MTPQGLLRVGVAALDTMGIVASNGMALAARRCAGILRELVPMLPHHGEENEIPVEDAHDAVRALVRACEKRGARDVAKLLGQYAEDMDLTWTTRRRRSDPPPPKDPTE